MHVYMICKLIDRGASIGGALTSHDALAGAAAEALRSGRLQFIPFGTDMAPIYIYIYIYRVYVYIYIYIYIHIHIYTYITVIYIYIYIYRERERERDTCVYISLSLEAWRMTVRKLSGAPPFSHGMHLHVYRCVCVTCIKLSVCVYVYLYTHGYVYTNVYAYTHMYTNDMKWSCVMPIST